jgi:dipeptidyl aminopeptidase/acylaminoacyl peptidase
MRSPLAASTVLAFVIASLLSSAAGGSGRTAPPTVAAPSGRDVLEPTWAPGGQALAFALDSRTHDSMEGSPRCDSTFDGRDCEC